MNIKKILNSMGFAGQLAKLGDVLISMQDEIEAAQEEITNLRVIAKIKVTFDSDGGSAVNSQIISYQGKADEPTEPTKDGYVFSKWVNIDGDEFDFDTELVTDTELTAVWEAESELES